MKHGQGNSAFSLLEWMRVEGQSMMLVCLLKKNRRMCFKADFVKLANKIWGLHDV